MGTDVIALQRGVLQDTLLVHVAHGGVVLELLRAAARRDVVLAGEAVVVINQGPVVRVRIEAAVLEALDALGGPERGLVVHLAGFVVPVDVLVRGQELRRHRVSVERGGAVVNDLRPAGGAALGRDHDHTVTAAHTVDGRRGRVLENGDRGDVVRVYVVHRALHAVHENQR